VTKRTGRGKRNPHLGVPSLGVREKKGEKILEFFQETQNGGRVKGWVNGKGGTGSSTRYQKQWDSAGRARKRGGKRKNYRGNVFSMSRCMGGKRRNHGGRFRGVATPIASINGTHIFGRRAHRFRGKKGQREKMPKSNAVRGESTKVTESILRKTQTHQGNMKRQPHPTSSPFLVGKKRRVGTERLNSHPQRRRGEIGRSNEPEPSGAEREVAEARPTCGTVNAITEKEQKKKGTSI